MKLTVGSFNKKVARIIKSFLAIVLQKFIARLVFRLGHFAPKSFAHALYSTIMGVVILEGGLHCMVTLTFCESVKLE